MIGREEEIGGTSPLPLSSHPHSQEFPFQEPSFGLVAKALGLHVRGQGFETRMGDFRYLNLGSLTPIFISKKKKKKSTGPIIKDTKH